MRVRLADADLLVRLAAHLRGSGFLVVRVEREVIEAHPLNSVSDWRDWRLLGEQIERVTAGGAVNRLSAPPLERPAGAEGAGGRRPWHVPAGRRRACE